MWIFLKFFLCSNDESQLEFEGERSLRRLPICINRQDGAYCEKPSVYAAPLLWCHQGLNIVKMAPNTALFFVPLLLSPVSDWNISSRFLKCAL